MSQRRGELTAARINRDWPHQVALPAHAVNGDGLPEILAFSADLTMCPRWHSFRRDDADYVVFCFAHEPHAVAFCEHFKGECIEQKDQPRRRSR